MGTPTSNQKYSSELEFYLPVNPGPETRQRELTQQPTFQASTSEMVSYFATTILITGDRITSISISQ